MENDIGIDDEKIAFWKITEKWPLKIIMENELSKMISKNTFRKSLKLHDEKLSL